jgi:two-component system sensor histidine kinase UhpB
MSLAQYLKRRLGVITLAFLSIFMLLLVSQALLSIDREKSGIENLLQLLTQIHQLESTPDDQFELGLSRVESMIRTQEFRHLQIEVRDASGKIIASNDLYTATNPVGLFVGRLIDLNLPLHKARPSLEKINIKGYEFRLTSSLISEQSESGTDLLFSMLTLAAFSLMLYLGLARQLGRALNPLNDSIKSLRQLANRDYENLSLESDIFEFQRINQAIQELSTSLVELENSRQLLSAKIISAQSQERAAIARELHDELGQKIAIIRLNGEYLRKVLKEHNSMHALSDIMSAVKGIVNRPGI